MAAWKSIAARAALVVASVSFVLAAVEIGIRVTGVAPLPKTAAGGFRPDNPLLRLLRPKECHDFGAPEGAYFVEVCTNSIGLRDRDHEAGESPRILGLGDSFTFGWGVEQSDTFLAHLERALRLGLPKVRPGVWNAGLSYTSQAHQDVLLRFLRDKEPFDAVVLAFSEDNDIDENIVWNPNLGVFPEKGEIAGTEVEAHRDAVSGAIAQDSLYRRSALVRFFRQRQLRTSMAAEVAALDERLSAHGLSGAPLSRMVVDEARRRFLQAFSAKFDDDWHVTEILLDRIHEFLKDRGVRLVLLRIPSKMSIEEPAWKAANERFCGPPGQTSDAVCGAVDRQHTARRLAAYARARKLKLIDPDEDLRKAAERGEGVYLPEDIHLSRLGHLRVGQRLARELVPDFGGTIEPQAAAPEPAAKRRQVGAYWYPWYRAEDWRSFTDYTPKGGAYLSTSPKVIQRQLHTADRGELDFLMVELLAGHNPESKFNDQAIDTLVDALESRRKRGFTKLQFAVMSDIFVGEADIATPERWTEFTRRHLDQIWTRFVEPHRDAYVRVDGKPLVGIFSPPVPIEDPRFTIVRPYWVSHEQWVDWSRKSEMVPFWDTTPQTITDRRFVSVTTGYNDWRLHRQPQVGPYLPRLGGRTFLEQWRAVYEVKPAVVLVYSFNEYFEQSQIEPTVEQGDRYLLLTELLARHYKDGRAPTAAEWDRLVDVIEPPSRPDEEKVAWLAIGDPRVTQRGLVKGAQGRLSLQGRAEVEFDVSSEQAFVLGIAHAPSFDRCAGLSVTVGPDPAKKVTFPTEITQLSILRDTPLPKSIGHVKITLERTKGSDECSSGGDRPIYISGITRYPLATSERLNFGVDDPRVALERFFLVESPPSGAFVWSSDRSTITLSGLAPASQHRVTLTFRDTGGFGDLELGPDEAHLKRVLITPGKTATPAEPFVATPEGTLQIALKTATWSPRERFKSEDSRNLGVAIRLITLDRVEGTSPSHERR